MRSSFRNESGEDIEQCRFAGSCAAADEDVLSVQDAVFQMFGEVCVEIVPANQVLRSRSACIELADRQCDAMQAARRNDSGDAAAVRQT